MPTNVIQARATSAGFSSILMPTRHQLWCRVDGLGLAILDELDEAPVKLDEALAGQFGGVWHRLIPPMGGPVGESIRNVRHHGTHLENAPARQWSAPTPLSAGTGRRSGRGSVQYVGLASVEFLAGDPGAPSCHGSVLDAGVWHRQIGEVLAVAGASQSAFAALPPAIRVGTLGAARLLLEMGCTSDYARRYRGAEQTGGPPPRAASLAWTRAPGAIDGATRTVR